MVGYPLISKKRGSSAIPDITAQARGFLNALSQIEVAMENPQTKRSSEAVAEQTSTELSPEMAIVAIRGRLKGIADNTFNHGFPELGNYLKIAMQGMDKSNRAQALTLYEDLMALTCPRLLVQFWL
jgi:hypothetical protein